MLVKANGIGLFEILPRCKAPARAVPGSQNERQKMNINEQLETYGTAALSDAEILTSLIGDKAAQTLLGAANSVSDLRRWSVAELVAVGGLTLTAARRLVAALGLAGRAEFYGSAKLLNTPELVYGYFLPIAQPLQVEKFWVLCLNRKNHLIKRVEITSGTASSSLVHPREVFRQAIIASACAIIAVHNHPSGDPSPSTADIQVTRQLREASRTVGIDLLDHIIIGNAAFDPLARGFYSFNQVGLI